LGFPTGWSFTTHKNILVSSTTRQQEPKDKAKNSTTGAAQQLEGHPIEPEVKKPWVQPSDQDKPTGEKEKTPAT
jgi:hypothetical protein